MQECVRIATHKDRQQQRSRAAQQPGLAKLGFLGFFGFLVFWFNHGFIQISPQTLIKPNLENARETAETAGNGRNDRRRSAQSTFELEPRAS